MSSSKECVMMRPTLPRRPRAGVVALAFPGYYLGEELAPAKYAEMLAHLRRQALDIVPVEAIVQDIAAAQQSGRTLAAAGVDFICAILTTFVPDHAIVELLQGCDVPIFLWAIEREIGCIALVGGLLINPTLYDLHKHYALYGSDIGDAATTTHLMIFARAAMLRQALRGMRVGYMGGNPEIMFSMAVDEVGLKQVLGVSVVPLRDVEYARRQEAVPGSAARADWEAVQGMVGSVHVAEPDALAASQGYLAAKQMAADLRLDALSLNCWSHLKSKICLPIARLNDAGISAACEGDLHATILMRLLYELTGRAALNGDFLRLFPELNQILFSHCGAGAFSMARSPGDIVLHASIETHDGLAVFFPADQPGTVTALNLMGSRAGYRLAVLVGQVAETDMRYEGTPMRLRFETPVQEILQRTVRAGAGHHWNLAYGDYARELELLCQFLGITYNLLS
jgi:L-fucose isomerase-like protein